jgi:hypothetical protein
LTTLEQSQLLFSLTFDHFGPNFNYFPTVLINYRHFWIILIWYCLYQWFPIILVQFWLILANVWPVFDHFWPHLNKFQLLLDLLSTHFNPLLINFELFFNRFWLIFHQFPPILTSFQEIVTTFQPIPNYPGSIKFWAVLTRPLSDLLLTTLDQFPIISDRFYELSTIFDHFCGNFD